MTPQRIQLRRDKGWRKPPNTVVVSRESGLGWGNPYVIGQPGIPDAETAVAKYRAYMMEQLATHQCVRDAIEDLRGKNLACWCRLVDQHGNAAPCHADVLLSLANDIPIEDIQRENIRRAKGEAVR